MKHGTTLTSIHPTAVIDDRASVGAGVSVGPYAVIGPGVEIGDRTQIGPHVVVERDTRVGAECRISAGAVLGTDPQDLKYVGERTWLEVGPRTVIREFATLNRGTAAAGLTVVGTDCLIMAYAHVAHDCRIGDHVVLSNATNMGGHVEIGEWAVVGGVTAIHQFVRIGPHAMVGGASRISRDVAPYTLVAGNPAALYGINRIGLERRGFEAGTIDTLSRGFRDIFRSKTPLLEAVAAVPADAADEVRAIADFVAASERGITTWARGVSDASPASGVSPDGP
ncbi:MAG: acyl-ACP--UDP-N-acetylglucosamine O-acyltransferase [Gemmatimonadota bacterium]